MKVIENDKGFRVIEMSMVEVNGLLGGLVEIAGVWGDP